MPKKENMENRIIIFKKIEFDRSLVFSCLHILFPKNKSKTNFLKTTSLCHGPLPFSTRAPLCLSHHKTRWTMSVDNASLKICLLGTSNSTVDLTCFPWCKPKWSQDELNNQSHILRGNGTTSWSMV